MKSGANLLLIIVFLGSIALLSWFTISDTDVTFHLAAGREIAGRKEIPQQNIFGYTQPEAAWASHQWLGSLIIYGAHRVGGVAGLQAMKTVVSVGLFALLLAALRREEWGLPRFGARPTDLPLASGVLAVAAWAARPRLVERPLLFSCLMEALLLWILAGYGRRSRRRLFWLIPLFALWWNLHAGYVYGLLIWGAFVVGDSLERGRRRDARFLLCTGLVGIGGGILLTYLVNPGSLGGLLFPWRMFRSPLFSRIIDEFRRTTLDTNPAFTILLFLAPVAVLLFWLRRGRPRAAHLLLLGGFTYLALARVRMIIDASIISAPIVAGCLAAALGGDSAERRGEKRGGEGAGGTRRGVSGWRGWPVLAAAVLITIIPWRVFRGEVIHFGHGFEPRKHPFASYEFLKREGLPGEVFVADVWSGSFLWHLFPEREVFIHNQLEVYGEDFWRAEYLPILAAREGWSERLLHHGVNTLLLRYSDSRYGQRIADAAFRHPDWELIWWDDLVMVFLRNTAASRGVIERHALRLVNPETPNVLRLASIGRGEEAEGELRRVLGESPRCRRAWSCLGELLLELGRLSEGEEAYRRLQALSLHRGERAAAVAGLARARWLAGDPAGGAELYRRALDESPGDPFYLSRRVAALVRAGSLEEAEGEARRLEVSERAGVEELVYAGGALADGGVRERAARLFSRAEDVAEALGRGGWGAGMPPGGARWTPAAQELARLGPGPARARAILASGVAWEKADERRLAEDAYRRAREEDPRWGDPPNNLAWLFLDEGRSGEAMPLAREAVGLGTEIGHYWGTLGRAYLETAKPDSAVWALERGVELLAGEEVEALSATLAELARAYLATNRPEEASEALARADGLRFLIKEE